MAEVKRDPGKTACVRSSAISPWGPKSSAHINIHLSHWRSILKDTSQPWHSLVSAAHSIMKRRFCFFGQHTALADIFADVIRRRGDKLSESCEPSKQEHLRQCEKIPSDGQ